MGTPEWTLYCHIHTESNRRYFGLTKKTWKKRWNRHVYDALHVKSGYEHFHNAIRKYGKDAFEHLEFVVKYSTIEEANAAEEFAIELFCTRDPNFGFNLARGGTHTPHPIKNYWDRPELREAALKRSKALWSRPEFRAKAIAILAFANSNITKDERSRRSKKLWSNPEFHNKMSVILKEAHARPSVRAKNSNAHKGKKLSPEHIEKAASFHRGKSLSAEHRAKLSASLKANTFTDEHRANIAKGQTGKKLSEETKAKIGAKAKAAAALRPKKRDLSPESRRKISEAAKRNNTLRKKNDTTLISPELQDSDERLNPTGN